MRRDLLHAGALTAFGLSLADLLLARQAAAAPPRARSCILLWLDGGPSHLEMFDPKPEAPAEIRGPFGAVETTVGGLRIGEHLPLMSRQMHQICLIRSLTHEFGNHDTGSSYLLTGRRPSTSLQYPSLGSLTASLRPGAGALPPYISIPEPAPAAGAGDLAGSWQPFTITGDPSQAAFQVADLTPGEGISEDRVLRRLQLAEEIDGESPRSLAPATAEERRRSRRQARDLITGSGARAAFDLSRESEATRNLYGRGRLGSSALMARRLVEAGVPFVTVIDRGWDTHQDIAREFPDSRFPGSGKLPAFDRACSGLIQDLKQRGLLDETLLIVMGEFGRTPKMNARGGRDHWPRAGFACLAGPVPSGTVIGRTDAHAESPSENPVSPEDLAATILRLLGFDPASEYRTRGGRTLSLAQGGAPIPGIPV